MQFAILPLVNEELFLISETNRNHVFISMQQMYGSQLIISLGLFNTENSSQYNVVVFPSGKNYDNKLQWQRHGRSEVFRSIFIWFNKTCKTLTINVIRSFIKIQFGNKVTLSKCFKETLLIFTPLTQAIHLLG